MTKIERSLYRDGSAHCISSFELSPHALVLTLYPWEQPEASTHARFEQLQLISTDNSYSDNEQGFPWDIIGFDSEQLLSDVWRFCLHTDVIEYVFDAKWPVITKVN